MEILRPHNILKALLFAFTLIVLTWLSVPDALAQATPPPEVPTTTPAAPVTPVGNTASTSAELSTLANNLSSRLDTFISETLDGDSVFTRHVSVLFYAFLVFNLFFRIWKYVFREGSFGEFFEFFILVIFITFIFNSYSMLTRTFWGWGIDVSFALQHAIIGDGTLGGPAQHISAVSSQVFYDREGLGWQQLIAFFIFQFIVDALVIIIALLAWITAIWPLLGYLLIKPIGFLLVPTLFFKKTSQYFDAFLNTFFGFIMFMLLSRVALCIVVLICDVMFGTNYPMTTANKIVVTSPNFGQVSSLMILLIMSIFLFGNITKIATGLTNGAGLSVGSTLQRAAIRIATRR